MKTFGIDISRWQKGINFDRIVADGVKFVILRAAYSTEKDAQFETFYAECKKRKLPVGAYIYSMAKNTAEARAEAVQMCKFLKGKQFELPIYFDIEDAVQKKLSKEQNTAVVKAFCDYMESAGYYVGIYSSKSFYADKLNDAELKKYAHWVAQWAKECTYGDEYGMWQFGGETNYIRNNKIAGVTVDQNYMFVDYPTIIKAAHLNGYKQTVVEKIKTVITKKAYTGVFPSLPSRGYIQRGDKGNNVRYLQTYLNWYGNYKLDVDGDFGVKTLAAVKDFQKKEKLVVDGLFGKKSLSKAKAVKK